MAVAADCPLDSVLLLDIANKIFTQKVVEGLATRLLCDCGGMGIIQRNISHGGAVDWNVAAHRVLTEWCRCKPDYVSGPRLYEVLCDAGASDVARDFQHRLGVYSTSNFPISVCKCGYLCVCRTGKSE